MVFEFGIDEMREFRQHGFLCTLPFSRGPSAIFDPVCNRPRDAVRKVFVEQPPLFEFSPLSRLARSGFRLQILSTGAGA